MTKIYFKIFMFSFLLTIANSNAQTINTYPTTPIENSNNYTQKITSFNNDKNSLGNQDLQFKTPIINSVEEKAIDEKIKEIQKPSATINNDINFHNENNSTTEIKTTSPEIKNLVNETKNEPNLWQQASLAIGFVSGLGLLAFLFLRIRHKNSGTTDKELKNIEMVSSLSISPKRQIMILRIKDKEIIIANTEHGIQPLGELSEHKEQLTEKVTEIKLPKLKERIDSVTQDNSEKEITQKKSEILLNAIRKMESNSIKKQEKEIPNEGHNLFPKYYSQAFEQEAKKEINKEETSEESIDNVTKMIREKLKSMKPLN